MQLVKRIWMNLDFRRVYVGQPCRILTPVGVNKTTGKYDFDWLEGVIVAVDEKVPYNTKSGRSIFTKARIHFEPVTGGSFIIEDNKGNKETTQILVEA